MEITMENIRNGFEEVGYISDPEVIVTVYLALKLQKPILIEGEPGVGKTELGKVLSQIFHTDLIRLQCYEGLDENKALYEWNYQKQLLKIQIMKETPSCDHVEDDLFSREYLLERPLLKAIQSEKKPVLLIDEVDKTDEEFEAFLFELLSDFQVSVPELGTLIAEKIPMVVLTSNNERELSDGLKRRCIYLFLDFPTVEREVAIIKAKVPEITDKLTRQIAKAVNLIRQNTEIKKKPSIAETLDWARALLTLNEDGLSEKVVKQTINILLKTKTDIESFNKQIGAAALDEFARS
ncbi:AAA family ATPase [Candidatus Contubernalis alkaliaceticus]|uniref:AAA family ATPase n=1 Tax=Candidatus Contubernalis alkaliaceticus TaxID=338645 RepID=UPI001F4BD90D|nr:MoxR family ATPase [Candidatus Contubernalis alkalaceticus]UNC90755.1 MoxR family ATPase [Candidatus Contubernalis alkalaceticus]